MYRVMYKLGHELGMCAGMLLSKKAIPLWIFLTVVYIMQGCK